MKEIVLPTTKIQTLIPEGVDEFLKKTNQLVKDVLYFYDSFVHNKSLYKRIKFASIRGLIQFLESFRIPEKACNFEHEVPQDYLEGLEIVGACGQKDLNLGCSHAEMNGLLMACILAERIIHEFTNNPGVFKFSGKDLFEAKARLDMDVNQCAQDGWTPVRWMGWAKPRQTGLTEETGLYVRNLITRLKTLVLVPQK